MAQGSGRWVTVFLLLAIAGMAGGAAEPTSRPAEVSLGNGLVRFEPPAAPWVLSSMPEGGMAVIYQSPTGSSVMAVTAVGRGAPRSDELAKAMAKTILDQIKGNFRRKNYEMIVEPEIVKDDRFWLVVHEKYKKEGTTVNQWHYYRNVPPHQFMVTVITYAQDQQEADQVRLAGETVALSAKVVERGEVAPPPPDATRGVGSYVDTASPEYKQAKADLDAAQAKLDASTTACLAALAKRPDFQAVMKNAEAAEARVKELRAAEPVDRPALATASREWIESKRPLETMRSAALAKDPAVAEARRQLDVAKARLNSKKPAS